MMTPEQYDDEHDETHPDTCPNCGEPEGHLKDCQWACIRCGGTKDDELDEFCDFCHEEGHGR